MKASSRGSNFWGRSACMSGSTHCITIKLGLLLFTRRLVRADALPPSMQTLKLKLQRHRCPEMRKMGFSLASGVLQRSDLHWPWSVPKKRFMGMVHKESPWLQCAYGCLWHIETLHQLTASTSLEKGWHHPTLRRFWEQWLSSYLFQGWLLDACQLEQTRGVTHLVKFGCSEKGNSNVTSVQLLCLSTTEIQTLLRFSVTFEITFHWQHSSEIWTLPIESEAAAVAKRWRPIMILKSLCFWYLFDGSVKMLTLST